jgi:hypothetical protein
VSPLEAEKYKMNIVSIAMRSYHFMFRANTFPEREICDLLIEPYNLNGYSNRELEKAEEINSDVTSLRESRDDIEEEMRAAVCKAFGNACNCSKTPNTTTKMDAKEYSTALFEMFRNGESSKENVEKSKLSVSNILEDLRTSDTTKKLAEKSTKAVLKTIEDCIKGLEKTQTAAGKEDVGKDDKKIDLRNAKVSALVEVTSFVRTNREYIVQANAAYLQALADRSRQNKAIKETTSRIRFISIIIPSYIRYKIII